MHAVTRMHAHTLTDRNAYLLSHTHTQAYTHVRGPAHAYVLKMAGGASFPPVTQLCRVQGLSDPRLSPLLDEEVEPWSWSAPHSPLQAARTLPKVRFTPLVQLPTSKGSSWEGHRDVQLWSWLPPPRLGSRPVVHILGRGEGFTEGQTGCQGQDPSIVLK